jgi:hypothetical protein
MIGAAHSYLFLHAIRRGAARSGAEFSTRCGFLQGKFQEKFLSLGGFYTGYGAERERSGNHRSGKEFGLKTSHVFNAEGAGGGGVIVNIRARNFHAEGGGWSVYPEEGTLPAAVGPNWSIGIGIRTSTYRRRAERRYRPCK